MTGWSGIVERSAETPRGKGQFRVSRQGEIGIWWREWSTLVEVGVTGGKGGGDGVRALMQGVEELAGRLAPGCRSDRHVVEWEVGAGAHHLKLRVLGAPEEWDLLVEALRDLGQRVGERAR